MYRNSRMDPSRKATLTDYFGNVLLESLPPIIFSECLIQGANEDNKATQQLAKTPPKLTTQQSHERSCSSDNRTRDDTSQQATQHVHIL